MPNVEHIGQYDSTVSYKKVFFWFLAVVFIISASAFYFILSKATITLFPKLTSQELETTVVLDPSQNEIDLENNTIRGITLSQESQLDRSFNNIVPKKLEENAIGRITIRNGYTRAQGYKKDDVLVTKNSFPIQKIALKEDVIVYRAQTKTVEAYALEKGIAGHIPPGEFVFEKYDDFMKEQIEVKSEETFQGGIRTANLITENDLVLAKKEVMDQIVEKNLNDLKEKLREGEILSQNNIQNEIVFFDTNLTPPKETDNFGIKMSVKTFGAIFKKEDLIFLLNEKLKKQANPNEEFVRYDPESLSFAVDKITPEDQKAYLKIKIVGLLRPKLSTKIFNKDEIKGYNEKAIHAHYEKFEELEKVEVSFWPRFRKTVPEMDNRIIIEISDK